MQKEYIDSSQRTINEFDYYTLKKRVGRAGTASVVFGVIQIVFAIFALIFLIMAFGDIDANLLIISVIVPLMLIYGVTGTVQVVLGRRIKTQNDKSIKSYLYIILALSIFTVFLVSGWGVILFVFCIQAIKSVSNLLLYNEYRETLHHQNYAFSGAWWAVLIVPALLIIVFSLLIMGNS